MADETAAQKVAALENLTLDERKRPPNPFSGLVKSICAVSLIDDVEDPFYKLKPDPLRIALVSMPVFPYTIETLSSFPSAAEPAPDLDSESFIRKLVGYG